MAEPPLADLGKEYSVTFPRMTVPKTTACDSFRGTGRREGPGAMTVEDESRLAWLLLRARDEDGKWRFLLQQRPDGTWGMPGGTTHVGEDPWARRTEGDPGGNRGPSSRVESAPGHSITSRMTARRRFTCGYATSRTSTPPSTGPPPRKPRVSAWFRRKEIGDLDLAPKFREDWEKGITPAGTRHQEPSADGERDRRSLHAHGGLSAPPGCRQPLAIPASGGWHGTARGSTWGRSRRHRGRDGRERTAEPDQRLGRTGTARHAGAARRR